MKNIVLSFIFLTVNVSFLQINAQSLETDPAEPIEVGQACEEIPVNYDITNITSGDLNFLWRLDRIDVPAEWQFQICDAVICYGCGVETCPTNNTNTMVAGQEITFMSVKVKPNNIPYVGTFNQVFYNENDENDIYLSLPMTVTATACTSGSDEIDLIENLNIYPNPTSDFFKVSNANVVDRLSIYNIVGKEVKSMDKNDSGTYDVSDVYTGMYLVRLFDVEGDVLKVVRMSKI